MPDDLDLSRRRLRARAPNKDERDIPLSAAAVRAFHQCRRWSDEARARFGEGDGRLLQYLALTPTAKAVVATTESLQHRAVGRFVAKWFAATGDDGHPMLASTDDPAVPIAITLRKLRNATVSVWAAEEPNVNVVKEMAGHVRLQTTGQSYAHAHGADLARRVHDALRQDAKLVALGVSAQVEDGEGEDGPAAADGLLDIGGCGRARAPRSEDRACTTPGGCITCDHLVLQVSKRFRLEAYAEREERKARRALMRGSVREAQRAAEAAKHARARLIRIDEFVAARGRVGAAPQGERLIPLHRREA